MLSRLHNSFKRFIFVVSKNNCPTIKKNQIMQMQRIANILVKAEKLGFEIDQSLPLEELVIQCEGFIIENTDPIEEEVDLELSGGNQHFTYSDGKGFNTITSGDIARLSRYGAKKVFHTKLVDTDANYVHLYSII